MTSVSPTAEGFRLIFRRPAIPLAEIAWRWSFAAAAGFLGTMFLFEYAASLAVSRLERLMLATHQPVLILRAIRRIFEGSGFRFTKAGVLLAVALVLAWIVLASLGRAVVFQCLIEEQDAGSAAGPTLRATIRQIIGLNFLRAAVSLAAIVASFGSFLLANWFWASTHVSGADSARLWIALLFSTFLTWTILNWLLSTACVFAASNDRNTFDAVSSTVRLCLDRPGAVVAVGIWFGLAHLGVFITASGAAFTVLSAASLIGGTLVLLLEFLLAIVYCGVVDCLYTGRLAAYVAMLRAGEVASPAQPTADFPMDPQDKRSAVDPGELILSDVPLLAN